MARARVVGAVIVLLFLLLLYPLMAASPRLSTFIMYCTSWLIACLFVWKQSPVLKTAFSVSILLYLATIFIPVDLAVVMGNSFKVAWISDGATTFSRHGDTAMIRTRWVLQISIPHRVK
jgi:hypothetical protein